MNAMNMGKCIGQLYIRIQGGRKLLITVEGISDQKKKQNKKTDLTTEYSGNSTGNT